MTVPSFARATAASTVRASPQGKASKDVTTQLKTPTETPTSKDSLRSRTSYKKLKRPSTLTKRVRQSIAYNADLYYIKPANPSKLCPLADLPSELRTQIYAHVFGDLRKPILMSYFRVRYAPAALLHICRAIRIEAAYVYFPEANFTWIVKNLNFSMVIRWLRSLQPSHRTLLSRNPNLTIEIFPGLAKSFTYPPKDFLLDDTLANHWKACQSFGNLYAVRGLHLGRQGRNHTRLDDVEDSTSRDSMRLYFVFFCRLAAWSRLCMQSGYTNIKWRYVFDMPTDRNGVSILCESLSHYETGLSHFLVQLKRLWARNQNASIRQPVMELVNAFIDAIAIMVVESSSTNSVTLNLPQRLMALRDRIEKWNRDPLTQDA